MLMSELVVIREMQEKDILALDTQFVQQGWPSRQEILMNYLEEQLVKQRTVFVAEKKATLLGYVTLLPLAKEGPFKNLYPEIGYVPDGSGVWFQNKQLKPNDRCVNDDALVLYLSKKL
ncbi:Uncharacterised protein [Acinetobacter baumannii]|uniref:hypothetical protein n=1 Tax=Acinetobacter baumannii TaxID=470 RepID=UPI000DE64404|nr:Uncharacterised protein [Acinetobacter baumannii]